MVIANSCAGSYCYQNKDEGIHYQYDNPFIGCTIFAKDWNVLLENFDRLNFLNIEVKSGIYPLNPEERYYIILDNKIQIWFIHYNNENIVKERWLDRAKRLIEFLETNKDWKEKILFVSSRYKIDNKKELEKTASYFQDYYQIIDIYSYENFYLYLLENGKISKNTILFNKKNKSFIYLSKFILENYKHFITNI